LSRAAQDAQASRGASDAALAQAVKFGRRGAAAEGNAAGGAAAASAVSAQ